MKRLNKGLLVTSGICGGLGLALLICGMLLGGIRGGNDLGDALSINSGDFQEMKDEVMSEISDHTNFDPVNWFVEWVTDITESKNLYDKRRIRIWKIRDYIVPQPII